MSYFFDKMLRGYYCNSLCHNCPIHLSRKCHTHLSHECPIPISFMCAENTHIMNINVPGGVGAPPLNTQLRCWRVWEQTYTWWSYVIQMIKIKDWNTYRSCCKQTGRHTSSAYKCNSTATWGLLRLAPIRLDRFQIGSRMYCTK